MSVKIEVMLGTINVRSRKRTITPTRDMKTG
jgi:hypothetical protein